MNTRLLLLLGCLLALSVHAEETKRELWKWKDANGVTQYSDRPVPGATKVELTGVTTPPSVTPAPTTAAPAARATVRAPAKAVVQYQALEIWQPAQDEAFFGADAAVNVRLRSDPDLAPGDRLVLALDGRRVDGRPDSYEYQLTDLSRGAHSLEAAIVDEQGNTKIRSEPRVFHVQQPTVNEPRAVGPKLNPPGQPRPTPGPKPVPYSGK
jgi:hypothetical protein